MLGGLRGPRQITLRGLLLAVAAAVVVVLLLAFARFFQQTRQSVAATSRVAREQEAAQVRADVEQFLGVAQAVVDGVIHGAESGAFRRGAMAQPEAMAQLEAQLYNELSTHPELSEVTVTGANVEGFADGDFDETGRPLLQSGRWQLSLFKLNSDAILSNWIHSKPDAESFVVETHQHTLQRFSRLPWQLKGVAPDPTTHPTFWVAASQQNLGHAVWSDLHYSELVQSETGTPRVILSLQQAAAESAHAVLVIRVGIATETLDTITQGGLHADRNPGARSGVGFQTVLLAASDGDAAPARMVARVTPRDHVVEVDGDLRVQPENPPEAVRALLVSPLLLGLDSKAPQRDGNLEVGPTRYLATLRGLDLGGGGTAGWLVAVLVPEEVYVGDLQALIRSLGWLFAGAFGLAILGAGFGFLAVKRGLDEIGELTRRMQAFDFSPQSTASPILEVQLALTGIERAKTVARAMGKYVPLELVQRLYQTNQEPALGGSEAELTVMFTDIAGFTSLAERLEPDALAQALGAYLEVATCVIQQQLGTIDKYVGDAIMALWNAPTAVEFPAVRACAAALECQEQLRALYASPTWAGLPALTTRFGIHTGNMLLGHFGAPSRLSYTVLGDAVNLAARLEPLCKQYQVSVLVSEDTAKLATSEFAFRRIDRVAVKGRTQGVLVYELLGRMSSALPAYIEAYELALDEYFARDFSAAARRLAAWPEDAASTLLLARCLAYIDNPPPATWDGVYVAPSK